MLWGVSFVMADWWMCQRWADGITRVASNDTNMFDLRTYYYHLIQNIPEDILKISLFHNQWVAKRRLRYFVRSCLNAPLYCMSFTRSLLR